MYLLKKTNIAILGSCVSRDNFNSIFNEDWRRLFNIVAYQHQTSIVSLMHKKVDFPQRLLDEHLRDFDKDYLISDFSKEFLKKIKDLQPEYLIIDFFADAYYGVLELSANKYITNNGGKLWNTTFYKELVNKKPINFINNNEKFLDLWIKSVEMLFEYLNENLPNTKILVTKFYFSEYYRCSITNKIKHITESNKHLVGSKEEYNKILNKIYNHIMKYNHIFYIDLTEKEYLLDEHHPWGLNYVHYEKDYYKDYINQLEKIVLDDTYSISNEISVNVKSINFNHKNGDFNLELELIKSLNTEVSKICFIERKDGLGNTLFTPKKLFFDGEKTNNGIKININFIENLEILLQSVVWDVYVYDEKSNLFHICNMDNVINFNAHYLVNNNRGIKPYRNGMKRLSIYCKKLIDSLTVLDESTTEYIKIIFNKTFSESYEQRAIVRFKRRIHRFIDSFDGYIDFNIEDNEATITLDSFLGSEIIQGDVYEAFLVFNPGEEQEYDIPIYIENIKSEYIILNEVFKVKKFISANNRLSLFFINNTTLKIKSLEINDKGYLKLYFNKTNNLEIKSLELIPYRNISYLRQGYQISDEYIEYKEDHIVVDINSVYSIINLSENNQFILKGNIQIIQDKKDKIIESICLSIEENLINKKYITESYTVAVSEGKSKECIFSINRRYKVAILGSCYTRAAFNSSPYYNPGYKDRYSIVLTQFHSSLISIMGDKKKIFEDKYFKKLNNTNKNYLKSDFEKEFFNNLKDSQPDYLVIDIFADAQKGIIIFPDQAIITGNVNVETSQLMFNLPAGTQVISPGDVDRYLPIWIDSARSFAKKIVDYIEEDKIIINYINATQKYINKNGEEILYDKNLAFIKKSNLLADWMNNYLRYLLPKAKVIDSRNLKYVGYEKHPLGNTPNHYQSGYYKDFMKLVDDIILNDL